MMREFLTDEQPETLEKAIELTRYAGLRIIDDYFGYSELQDETARDIATLLYEPGTDYLERLDTYEYVNRSARAAIDEFELIAAIHRMDEWTGQNGETPAGLVKGICIATELDSGFRRVEVNFSKPSSVMA